MDTNGYKTLLKYNERIEKLPQLSMRSPCNMVFTQIKHKCSKVIDGRHKKLKAFNECSKKQLLMMAERWNQLLVILNVARHYLKVSVYDSYVSTLFNSVESTRLMHVHTSIIWYNSIVDFILQFYYLADKEQVQSINDNNYDSYLPDLRRCKNTKTSGRNNKDREKYIPPRDRPSYEKLKKAIAEVNSYANTTKHRKINILPKELIDKTSVGVIPPFTIKHGIFCFENETVTKLSNSYLQNTATGFKKYVNCIIKADKAICKYLKRMERNYFPVQG